MWTPVLWTKIICTSTFLLHCLCFCSRRNRWSVFFSPKYMFYTSIYMYIFQNCSFCPRIPESHKTSYIVTSVWFVILYSLQGLCLNWLVCKSYKGNWSLSVLKPLPLLLSYLDLIPGFDTTHWLCRRILNYVYTCEVHTPDLVYAYFSSNYWMFMSLKCSGKYISLASLASL